MKRSRPQPPGPAKRAKTDRARPYAQPSPARQNYYTVARTRGAIVQEMNYFDSALDAKLMTATTSWSANNQHDPGPGTLPVANINCLFAPTQGTAVNNRLGRKVYVHRLRVKGIIYQPGLYLGDGNIVGNSPQQLVRLILFCDKQTNAAQVGAATLMTNMATSTGGVMVSFQNRDQVGRFDVYKDKTFRMPVPTVTQFWDVTAAAQKSYQQGVQVPFKFVVNFKTPLCVNFNANSAGTIGDIVDNSFHIYGSTTNARVGSATACQLSYQARTYFKE